MPTSLPILPFRRIAGAALLFGSLGFVSAFSLLQAFARLFL